MNQSAREQAQKQWNTNPCGAVEYESLDKDYFKLVEENRYKIQYWQKSFFKYNSFSNKEVLEIGVGHGTDLRMFAESGAIAHGIDITQKHLELTKLNFDLHNLKVNLTYSDGVEIPYPENTFDVVYSFGVLHHIPDMGEVLDQIYRVLKPNGRIMISVYHKFSIHTFSLFLKSILNGRIFKLGIEGVLATIETGADGINIKPYVKLYSKNELNNLLKKHNFKILQSSIDQINFDKNHKLHILRMLDHKFGWYVSVIGEKESP